MENCAPLKYKAETHIT